MGIQVGWSLFHRRARRGRPISCATYGFFTGVGSHYAVTPTLSIGVSKDRAMLRAGLCRICERHGHHRDRRHETLGECKSFNDFAEIDIRRMKNVVERFPDGVILFSTLKKELSPKEVSLLLDVAAMPTGNRIYPLPRLLVLTGHELMNHNPPPYCWSSQQKAKVPQYVGRDLMELCDATGLLYLDLEPYHNRVTKARKESANGASSESPTSGETSQ